MTPPGVGEPPGSANYAVFGHYVDPVNFLTPVGAYTLSAGPYGTFDQGGRVAQWNEAKTSATSRGTRGGSFFGDGTALKSDGRGSGDSTGAYQQNGFRLVWLAADVPEAGTLARLL